MFSFKVLRAEPIMSKEKGEVYYITPNGKKLRTRHEIKNHLHDDLTINNFTLVCCYTMIVIIIDNKIDIACRLKKQLEPRQMMK